MSCLFDVLSVHVGMTSIKLRLLICEHLETNPIFMHTIRADDVIQWEANTNRSLYIEKMMLSSTWGGAIEIKCFCDIFGKSVVVHTQGRSIEFVTNVQVEPDFHIHLIYDGSHYTLS